MGSVPRSAVAALVSAVLAAGASVHAAPDLPLTTAVVGQRDLATEHIFDAYIEAVQKATVTAQTAGRVLDVMFDVDDYVPKDSILIRIRDTEHGARVAQAEASLKEAQARLKEAQDQHQRLQGLFEKQHVSQADMDRAQADLEAGKARVEASRASLQQAREQLGYTVVKAPYSGIVVERHVEPGESVNPGQPLMTGFSLERLRAVTVVPQNLIEPVRDQAQARILVTGQGDREILAERLTFTPYADQKTHTFKVRVDLPAGELGIYPGAFVKVGFVTGRQPVLTVPSSAGAYRSEVRGLYVVRDDGSVLFRQVRLGRAYGDQVEILAGLDAGERIALDPVAAAVYLKKALAGSPS
jgi:RND family efflux transporter MFP subunit